MNSQGVLIDTDPGIDDALAIMLLKALNVNIKAITTIYGNSNINQTTENALKLVYNLNLDVPVIQGLDKPLNSIKKYSPKPIVKEIQGSDGMADSKLLENHDLTYLVNAPEYISNFVEVGVVDTILAMGPLTNIATAFQKYPEKMRSLKKLIIMGGVFPSIGQAGNASPYAEANFLKDPDAVKIILENSSPDRTTIVPLNTTYQTPITKNHLGSFQNKSGKLAKDLIKKTYLPFYLKVNKEKGCMLHDVVGATYLTNPEFFKTRQVKLNIHTLDGDLKGMIYADFRKKMQNTIIPNVTLAENINYDYYLVNFINAMNNCGVK